MTLLELGLFTLSIIILSVSLTLYFIDITKRIKMLNELAEKEVCPSVENEESEE
jgi:hypothetical protein